jgi:hypothetical protein
MFNTAKVKRAGVFYLPFEVLESFDTSAKRIMGKCIVFRAETLWHMQQVEYYAISDCFEEVPEGQVIPHYEWIFDEGHPTAVRVKEF